MGMIIREGAVVSMKSGAIIINTGVKSECLKKQGEKCF